MRLMRFSHQFILFFIKITAVYRSNFDFYHLSAGHVAAKHCYEVTVIAIDIIQQNSTRYYGLLGVIRTEIPALSSSVYVSKYISYPIHMKHVSIEQGCKNFHLTLIRTLLKI